MSTAWTMFRDCGSAAWLCLFLGIVGTAGGALGVAFGALKKRGPAQLLGAVAIAFGALSFGAGIVGRMSGERMTEAAIASGGIDPDQKERIRAIGKNEAGQCVSVGAAAGAFPFLLGALAVGLGLALRQRS